MKFDSPIFDKIRVKPSQDRRPKAPGPTCEWAGCKEQGTHKAPKGRGRENEYWRYCVKHVREYNQNYNFFQGMKDDAILSYQKDALTGHRPTWKMGTGKRGKRSAAEELRSAADPFGVFHEQKAQTHAEPKVERRTVRNAERKAFDTLGLEIEASAVQVKARFKELVKRHHPDVNGGDRSTEDRLVEIIQAYNYLKSVGMG
ncbi:MAG: J domain-containing protein [Pseudolabrys sp.]